MSSTFTARLGEIPDRGDSAGVRGASPSWGAFGLAGRTTPFVPRPGRSARPLRRHLDRSNRQRPGRALRHERDRRRHDDRHDRNGDAASVSSGRGRTSAPPRKESRGRRLRRRLLRRHRGRHRPPPPGHRSGPEPELRWGVVVSKALSRPAGGRRRTRRGRCASVQAFRGHQNEGRSAIRGGPG